MESNDAISAGTIGMSFLGMFTSVLGFLVVFRSQQAYSRWWEGGTLLQELRGEWFNAYSSLLAFCNPDPAKEQDVLVFQHRLVRLVSLLYASALEQVTTMESADFELLDLDGFGVDSLEFMQDAHDRCEIVLQWIQRLIVEANAAETIKVAPPILSRVYNQLGNGIVNLNNARKITDFPIPFPLAQMVTFMLLLHWVMTTVLCAASIDTAHWAGVLSFIVVFAFWSINYIAVELEMPFGDDTNDLPLSEMQKDLNNSLIGLLQPLALTTPSFILNQEHLELKIMNVDFHKFEDTVANQKSHMELGPAGRSSGVMCESRSLRQDRKKRKLTFVVGRHSKKTDGTKSIPMDGQKSESSTKSVTFDSFRPSASTAFARPSAYTAVAAVAPALVLAPPPEPSQTQKAASELKDGKAEAAKVAASSDGGRSIMEDFRIYEVSLINKRIEDHLAKIVHELREIKNAGTDRPTAPTAPIDLGRESTEDSALLKVPSASTRSQMTLRNSPPREGDGGCNLLGWRSLREQSG